MKLLDLITGHWAILPETLVELQGIYATHMRGDKIDMAAVEARLGRQLASEQQEYEVRAGGVAVLQANGVMAPKANLMMQISGGVSTQMLTKQFESMAADDRVRAVVFVPDSPGGSVLGIPTAAKALAILAELKPTVTVVQGVMASAMYWTGSASRAIYIDGETDVVGSLGVIQRIGWDGPEANRMNLVRGRYKLPSRDGMAPSAEYLEQANAQLDYLYAVLVDTVAQHRGVSSEEVLQHMADGRVFVGQQAINAGLVDGVSTVEAMVEQLATNPARFKARRKASFAVAGLPAQSTSAGAAPTDDITQTEKGNVMPDALSRESLQRDHADLYAALQQDFTAQGKAQAEAEAAAHQPNLEAQARTCGAEAERARIQAVFAQGKALPGHQALIEQLAFDGKTTGPEAAVAIVQAESAARTQAIGQHQADAPKPAPRGHAPAPGAEAGAADDSGTIAARAVALVSRLRNPQKETSQ